MLRLRGVFVPEPCHHRSEFGCIFPLDVRIHRRAHLYRCAPADYDNLFTFNDSAPFPCIIAHAEASTNPQEYHTDQISVHPAQKASRR
jgi:hypothetical protein